LVVVFSASLRPLIAPSTTPQIEYLSPPGMIQPKNSRSTASASALSCRW
jgi:hypothetical protein